MNEYFAQTLASVLEETSTNMGNAMILGHLSKNGSVTLEEAEFYHNLCADVITEAAEDFIPDELNVPDAEPEMEPIELYDAVGNKYVFQDGQLIPVEGDVEDEGEGDYVGDQDVGDAGMAPQEAPQAYQESEEVAPVIEESEIVAESALLEESSSVVARILANLK